MNYELGIVCRGGWVGGCKKKRLPVRAGVIAYLVFRIKLQFDAVEDGAEGGGVDAAADVGGGFDCVDLAFFSGRVAGAVVGTGDGPDGGGFW